MQFVVFQVLIYSKLHENNNVVTCLLEKMLLKVLYTFSLRQVGILKPFERF